MNLWNFLAEVVMYMHVLLPLLFVGFIVFSLFREVGFKWRLLCYVIIGVWVIMEIAPKVGWTKYCPLTDLEYLFRRFYDPSESWIRTRSLPATIIFDISGIEVPEFIFTIIFGIILAAVISIFMVKDILHKRLVRNRSGK